jgi:hypothetical protein
VEAISDRDPCTSDGDVLVRRWLPVDEDPRPASISANDAEHAAALALVQEVKAALVAAGWPPPVETDSSMRAHLLWAVC